MAFKTGEWFRYGLIYGVITAVMIAFLLTGYVNLVGAEQDIVNALGQLFGQEFIVPGLATAISLVTLIVALVTGVMFIVYRWIYQIFNLKFKGLAKYASIALIGVPISLILGMMTEPISAGEIVFDIMIAFIITFIIMQVYFLSKMRLPE